MPPKKAAKAADIDPDGDPGLNPATLLSNYTKFCKLVGVTPNAKLVHTLSDEESLEGFMKTAQIVIDSDAPLESAPSAPGGTGPLGPAGTRALCTAIMGNGPGMNGSQCRLVKSIRIWRSGVGDDGAACLAELLRLGGAEVPIAYLELLDNAVGPRGARALGQSLSYGHNRSLLTLKLDYNTALQGEGVVALCQGLRTNSTLKQLHLPYCAIGPDGGAPLGEMLSYQQSSLSLLNLQGNPMGGEGLAGLCDGMRTNIALTSLSVADNSIGQGDEDLVALQQLAHVIARADSPLAAIDLLYNRIGERGAEAMLAIFNDLSEKQLADLRAAEGGLASAKVKGPPAKVKQMLVDSTLPQQLFDFLCRIETKGGGKKKGKKGGKKKKK